MTKALKNPTEAPATDVASCARYKARAYRCDCPNRAKGGGSYIDERTGDKMCKHMAAIRSGAVDELDVKSLETGKPVEQLKAESAVRFEKATGKPADPRRALAVELKSAPEGSPLRVYLIKRLRELNDLAAAQLSFSSPQVRLILAGAKSTDRDTHQAAKELADELGTSLAAVVRRAEAIRARVDADFAAFQLA